MARRRLSRRRLLAGSVPVAVGLAGCSSDGDGSGPATDGDGGTTASETTDGTATGTPTAGTEFPSLSSGGPVYRYWQPGTGDLRAIQDAAHNVGRVHDLRGDLPAAVYENRTSWAALNGYVGIEFGELDGVIVGLAGVAAVYVGSFARSDVTKRLGSTPYEPFRRVEGTDYYRWDRPDGTTFVGVGDGAVVAGPAQGRDEDPAARFVEGTTPLFATAAGERPRLHEESALYERYTEDLGWPLFAWAGAPLPGDGPVGGPGGAGSGGLPGGDAVSEDVAASVRYGYGRHLADGSLVDRYWLWTVEDGPASPEDVRAAYEDEAVQSAILDSAEHADLALRTDDRLVELALIRAVEDPGGGVSPPLVAADATVDAGSLALEHFAGDPLPLGRVTVRGVGDPIPLGEGDLSPGESVSVDLPEDARDRLTVVYSPPTGDSPSVIART